MSVLVEVCDSLVSKSYFQLMNSLKTEFRRGSSKLVLTDRLQYFHLVWFLTSYHRMKIQALKSHYKQQMKAYEKKKEQLLAAMDFESPQPSEPEKPDYEEKAVLATLDMFSFNFVLQSVENYASVKNYHGMTVSVQLLTEMMAYIAEMAASDDLRFQRIADSLQHKIFYERDFLDRLPVLLKTWTPGSFPRAYVTDVVTLTHVRSTTRWIVDSDCDLTRSTLSMNCGISSCSKFWILKETSKCCRDARHNWKGEAVITCDPFSF